MMSQEVNSSEIIGDQKNIKTDIEYVRNQLEYLKQFHVQILNKSKYLKSFSTKWHGPKKDEAIYKEINRWIKCYNQLADHLKVKNVPDEEVKALQSKLDVFVFTKPTNFNQDAVKGFKKFAYKALPFYRIAFNKEKAKQIKMQILSFSKATASLNTLAFKVEAFYMDGV